MVPQILYVSMIVLSLVPHAVHHGKPRGGRFNIFATLPVAGVHVGLVAWGGFFA